MADAKKCDRCEKYGSPKGFITVTISKQTYFDAVGSSEYCSWECVAAQAQSRVQSAIDLAREEAKVRKQRAERELATLSGPVVLGLDC